MQRRPRLLVAAVLSTLVAASAQATPAGTGTGTPVVVVPVAPAQTPTRATCENAVRQLASTSPKAHALWRPGQIGPSVISGLKERTVGETPSAQALDFVAHHGDVVGVDVSAMRVSAVRPLRERTVVMLQQVHTIGGVAVDVWHHTMAVTVDQLGRVIAVSNDTSAIGDVALATISIEQAHAVAVGPGEAGAKDGTRTIVVGGAGAFEAAVFQVAKVGTFDAVEVVINLHDGTVSSRQSAVRR